MQSWLLAIFSLLLISTPDFRLEQRDFQSSEIHFIKIIHGVLTHPWVATFRGFTEAELGWYKRLQKHNWQEMRNNFLYCVSLPFSVSHSLPFVSLYIWLQPSVRTARRASHSSGLCFLWCSVEASDWASCCVGAAPSSLRGLVQLSDLTWDALIHHMQNACVEFWCWNLTSTSLLRNVAIPIIMSHNAPLVCCFMLKVYHEGNVVTMTQQPCLIVFKVVQTHCWLETRGCHVLWCNWTWISEATGSASELWWRTNCDS